MSLPKPHFDPTTVAAAVFDIGGVFTYPRYRPIHQQLRSLGVTPPADVIAYRQAHHLGVRSLTDAILADDGQRRDETDQSLWTHYDHAYTGHLGVAEADRDRLTVATLTPWDWLHEENAAAFRRLAASGLPVAIVSNNDGTALDQMRDHGICQVGEGPLTTVAAIVDSGIVGIAKPNPAIFTPALEALGMDPSTVVYVGDTVHADVHGATRAGMQVVQLDPFDNHGSFDHARMSDVEELAASLIR